MPAEGCSGHVDSVPRHGAGSGKRRHPVVRLVRWMLAHRRVLGFTCIVAAVLWLLAFPLACISCGELKCRGTYIGENALQVHSGKRAFGDKTEIHGAGEHMRWLRDAAISWHVNVSAALHQSQRVQGRAVSVPASAAVSAKWFFQELQVCAATRLPACLRAHLFHVRVPVLPVGLGNRDHHATVWEWQCNQRRRCCAWECEQPAARGHGASIAVSYRDSCASHRRREQL